jgi:hypothetical protein
VVRLHDNVVSFCLVDVLVFAQESVRLGAGLVNDFVIPEPIFDSIVLLWELSFEIDDIFYSLVHWTIGF